MEMLRGYVREYEPADVLEILNKVGSAPHEISHLLGSCDRLLEDNPDNAAFHCLRAVCYVLIHAYSQDDAKHEVIAGLDLFRRQRSWAALDEMELLLSLTAWVTAADTDRAEVFQAVLVDVHNRWLKEFTAGAQGGEGHV